MENELNHFDEKGNAVMVDVGAKAATQREAIAKGRITVSEQVMAAIAQKTTAKGDVLAVAQVAGIMAAKRTWELIPLCHPLLLTKCSVEFTLLPKEMAVEATALVRVNGQTGVEMEALTAVSTALLTIYDMCKAIDKHMVMSDIHLEEKTGGKSGDFRFEK